MSEYDNVEPKENWEFDESVADCFENMLERSIPQYDVMRESVTSLVGDVLELSPKKETFRVLDLGCSNGLMLETLYDNLKGNGYYVGNDVSEPMLKKAKYRLLDQIINNKISIINCDLKTDFPDGMYDIITSILTVQFVPITYRQSIIQTVYDRLSPSNGCFIMVEKVLGNTAKLNDLFVGNYHRMKEKNGYSQEQIERKKLSLEGVLVPVTNDWNIELLRQAGFRQVDVFWRWMNFVGYIAIK